MPSSDVLWNLPLVRQKIFYPGQFGVPGTDSERGLRTDVNGTVFYVDPNASGVTDLRDGTDPECPLQTVAAALTHCQPYRNDVIAVMANGAWQYGENLYRTTPVTEQITVTVPGVRIVGLYPPGSVGVPWVPTANGGVMITVEALDVLIEGFAFTSGTYSGDAIYAEWDGATKFADNLTVRNCVFDDTVDKAIQLEYAWYCDIHHNWFVECDEHGVYIDPAGSGAAYSHIHDNIFHDCAVAMALSGLDNSWVVENIVYNSSAQSGAAATDEGILTTGGQSNIVARNIISCLLPVPANGDYDDLNTAAATDAWIGNELMNGPSVTNPT